MIPSPTESPIPSLWISANAGSGKTHALTARVVELLLRGVVPERIYCITYTKAAAGEMRERILKSLRALLVLDDASCREKVAEILGHEASVEELTRARSLFAMMLDSPFGGVQLTTIHGFCQQLLQKFPMEAGVPPLFRVLEDSERETLQRTARMRLFDMHTETEVSEALALLAETSAETRVEAILDAIDAQPQEWNAVFDNHAPEQVRERIYAQLGVSPKMDGKALQEAFCRDFLRADEASELRAALPELLNHKNKGEQKLGSIVTRLLEAGSVNSPLEEESKFPDSAFPSAMADERGISVGGYSNASTRSKYPPTKIAKGDFDSPSRGELTEPTARSHFIYDPLLLDDLLAHFTTADNRPNSRAFSKTAPVLELLDRLRTRCVAHRQQVAALACAEESSALMWVAYAYRGLMKQLKYEHQSLDYQDLIDRTSELLTTRSMIGWVMRKLDHRIDHLLIDEAQDTSPNQWRIARALVDELIATNDGVGSGGIPRSLLVVGDEKQSIFSFQGAAPKLFASEEQYFAAALHESNAPLERQMLDLSYRSTTAVLPSSRGPRGCCPCCSST